MDVGAEDGFPTFDLRIELADAESGALKLTQLIRPKWSIEHIKLKKFTGGITNTLMGCWHKDDPAQEEMVLIRIYGPNSEIFVDRDAEIHNIRLLHAAGCARPLFARFANGIAYGFVPGTCLDETNVRDPVMSRLVAQLMVKIHSIDPDEIIKHNHLSGLDISRKPVIFKWLWKWLDFVPDEFSDTEMNKRYKSEVIGKLQMRRELEMLQRELESVGSPVFFCHNDLIPANIVYDEKKGVLAFIDCEFAGFNYEGFDIGNHFAQYGGVDNFDSYPDREYQLQWLRTYLEFKAVQQGSDSSKVTDRDVEVLYVQVNKFALTANFGGALYGLIQAGVSSIDFDFLGYGISLFNEYFAKRDACLSLKMPA